MKKLILCLAFLITTAVGVTAAEHKMPISITDGDTEFLAVSVLKPGMDSFENVTEQNADEAFFDAETLYVTPDMGEYIYKLVIDTSDPVGKYTVRITHVNTDRTKTFSEMRYYEKLSSDETDDMLGVIAAADDVAAKLRKYNDENKVVLPIEKIEQTADFDSIFSKVVEEKYKEGFAGIEELYTAVDMVYFIKDFGTAAAADLEEYITVNQKFIPKEAEAYINLTEERKNYAANIYKTEKDTAVQSMSEIEEILQRAIGMSIIKNGDLMEKTEVFKNYADAFGLDIEKVEANGVSLSEIAQLTKGETASDVKKSFDEVLATLIEGDSGSKPSVGNGVTVGRTSKGTSFTPVIKTPESEAPVVQTTPESSFGDMNAAVWAIEYVEDLYEKGIVSGNGDGNFRPAGNITRAEFVKMVVLAYGYTMKGAEKEFSDSNKNDWYYPYIVAAYNNGIAKGITDEYFGANENITRQDMAVILYRVMKLSPNKEERNFCDKDSIAEYAKDAVNTLAAKGILNGFEDGSFGAVRFASRAEAAALISRSMQR